MKDGGAASRDGRATWISAIALSLGAAVSLGLARFSYALLLPPMRSDLGWSYVTAGAMNTVNAAGYLVGALAMPALLRRFDARAILLAGAYATAAALAAHGMARQDAMLYVLRALAGVLSAATFVAGGLLAARLGREPDARPAIVLGLYYGGTGIGIIASALLVPPVEWPTAWWLLAAAALLASMAMGAGTRRLSQHDAAVAATSERFPFVDFFFGLTGYLMFGLGYIGYMTFIVTLLREQGVGPAVVVAFYVLVGAGVVTSSWLWAPLLHHYHGGQPLAILNALLALATALPVWSAHPAAAFASGALFGAVFLSVVAATTALVRHNLPVAAWPAGISAFTIVFAAGQIVGPTLVGWVADGGGGLRRGLAYSAGALALGAVLAAAQRAPRP